MGFMRHLLPPPVAKLSPKRTVPLSVVGDGSGNSQFQFGPSSRTAPGFQMRTDFSCAFPHSSHPPVAGFATRFDNFRVDTAPVVPKSQAQLRGIISDFDFNAFCTGVVQRVYERLLAEPIC